MNFRRLLPFLLALALALAGCAEDAEEPRACLEDFELTPGLCAHVWTPNTARYSYDITIGIDERLVLINDELYDITFTLDGEPFSVPSQTYLALEFSRVGRYTLTAPGGYRGTIYTRLP